jgi:hypothetical protein
METTLPLDVRLLSRLSARWLKRALWIVAILAGLTLVKLTLLRPHPFRWLFFASSRAASRRP